MNGLEIQRTASAPSLQNCKPSSINRYNRTDENQQLPADRLASTATKDTSINALDSLPGLVLQEIASHLLKIDPSSIENLRKVSETLAADQALLAAAYAIDCTKVKFQFIEKEFDEEHIPQLFDKEIENCRSLDAKLRKLHLSALLELSRFPIVKRPEYYHYDLWLLAKDLQPRDKSKVLQGFIDSIPFMDRLPSRYWFDRHHANLRDEKIPNRSILYASLADVLTTFLSSEQSERFPDVYSDICSLPSAEQAYPLGHLASAIGSLDSCEREPYLSDMLKRVDVRKDEQSVHILLGLMRCAHQLSLDQRDLLSRCETQNVKFLRDPKLLIAYARMRSYLVANMSEELKLEAFCASIEFSKNAPLPSHVITETDKRQWQDDFFSPLFMAWPTIDLTSDSFRALTQLAKFIPYYSEDSESRTTFADLFSHSTMPRSEIVKKLDEHCARSLDRIEESGFYVS